MRRQGDSDWESQIGSLTPDSFVAKATRDAEAPALSCPYQEAVLPEDWAGSARDKHEVAGSAADHPVSEANVDRRQWVTTSPAWWLMRALWWQMV